MVARRRPPRSSSPAPSAQRSTQPATNRKTAGKAPSQGRSRPPPKSPPGRLPAERRPVARPPRSRKPWLLAGVAFGLLALAAAGLLLGYGRSRGPLPERVELEWPGDMSADEAAELLTEAGLVESEALMASFLRATGGVGDFVPGWHLLSRDMSPWDLRRHLRRADGRPTARVVIPEGYNRFEIAARLEKLGVAGRRAFLAATADGLLLDELGIERGGAVGAESAEGFLFPATYELATDTEARDVVRRLVGEAERRWKSLAARHPHPLASLSGTLGFGRREIFTLASIVEKEAAVDEERPLVASVFLNRLLDPKFVPKKLQSDPTAAYGCQAAPEEAPSCAGYRGKPTPAINRDSANRYSTYAHTGLPPGPIANPGARSLEAVLAPATTQYLYFVAAGAGRHTFSDNLDSHNEAVRKLRAATSRP